MSHMPLVSARGEQDHEIERALHLHQHLNYNIITILFDSCREYSFLFAKVLGSVSRIKSKPLQQANESEHTIKHGGCALIFKSSTTLKECI